MQCRKPLFLDIVATLVAHGYNANDIPAKLEGLAFGPDVVVGGVKKHTLFVANDNDFLGTVTDTNHPAGIANPNQFFAFAWDPSDLPAYVAQKLPGVDDDRHGDHRRDHGDSDHMCGPDRDDDH